jgi:hypothetical protein
MQTFKVVNVCVYGVESSQDVSSDVIPTQRTDYFIQL